MQVLTKIVVQMCVMCVKEKRRRRQKEDRLRQIEDEKTTEMKCETGIMRD